MPDATAAFVGKIPENYDRYLAPLFFNDYADDLVGRLPVSGRASQAPRPRPLTPG